VKELGTVVVRDTDTLALIDTKFKKNAPAGLRFDYVVRGQPVHKVFWDIFTARIVGNVLYIRPELSREDERRRMAAEASVAAGAGGPMVIPTIVAVEGVSAANNPFKAKSDKDEKKKVEPKKPAVVFKKPGAVRKAPTAAFATVNATVARLEPPPQGLGSGLPTGPATIEAPKTAADEKKAAPSALAGGDPFKARAAQFKAL